MSKALIEKLLRAREFGVPVDGKTYTVRRPTDADIIGMSGQPALDFIKKFVIGWQLSELDLGVPGGSADLVPFHEELWAVYVADHPALWGPLGSAISDSYYKHVADREGAEKN